LVPGLQACRARDHHFAYPCVTACVCVMMRHGVGWASIVFLATCVFVEAASLCVQSLSLAVLAWLQHALEWLHQSCVCTEVSTHSDGHGYETRGYKSHLLLCGAVWNKEPWAPSVMYAQCQADPTES
jgi:hypothetical protein